MVAAIEIYNKPSVTYRNECTVILIMNSWELVLKALLVLNGQPIFRKTNKHRQMRTLTWQQAWHKSRRFLPLSIAKPGTLNNRTMLAKYRDQAVHFYNSEDIGISLYCLFQAAIVNYRDLIRHAWSIDIADEMSWHLLPIGMRPPTDIESYLAHATTASSRPVASTFLADIHTYLADLIQSGDDVDRFLVTVAIKLESVRSIDHADAVVGIDGNLHGDNPTVIGRTLDPNLSHPFRQKDVLAKLESSQVKMTQHDFQAIVWTYKLKSQKKYCWIAKEGVLTRYSPEVLKLIRSLSDRDVQGAVVGYGEQLRERRRAQS